MNQFYSTKTYDHNEGLSCVFRQWKADNTHCRFLHGYALKFKVTFSCHELDERNWVQNFGGLKEFKEWLHYMFDHTMLVAEDDPFRERLELLQKPDSVTDLAQIRIVPAVGCEQIAKLAFDWLVSWLTRQKEKGLNNFKPHEDGFEYQRVNVVSVEVSEHQGNSAIYTVRT